MSIYGDRAVALHGEGYSCSQSVVASLCEEFGVDRVTAFRFAAAFGSGIGHSTETCGAVTGAMMLIGLKQGKIHPDDDESNPECYEVAQVFFKRFMAEFDGHFKCRDLLGADTNTEEGKAFVEEHNMYETKCNDFIRYAAEIAADLLSDHK
ncbi:MAG: C-GCAxxG-C-C family protein [Christensenellaceae bacterium]|jgi:C_GCAxxG_C_C family probable redox protein